MRELQEILYFDEVAIEDLSNQVGYGKLETFSSESQKSGDRSSGIKPKLGLGHIIKALGGPTLDVDAEINRKQGQSEKSTENFVATRQDHYRRVVDALGGYKQLGVRLDRAWHLALVKGGSVFCIVEEHFKPLHTTTDADGWRAAANNMQFLQLVDEPTRLFRVGMSFDKMVGIRDGMIWPTGHLAVRLSAGSLPLRIFGKMDKTRYIKPFVISWN